MTFLQLKLRGGTLAYDTLQNIVNLPVYRIGKYPVTNSQFEEFVREQQIPVAPETGWNGQRVPPGLEKHPVIGVTWYEARAYCQWLSEKTGRRENIEGWVRFQAVAAITILVAYWAWFAWYTIPEPEFATLKTAILAKQGKTEAEWSQFNGFPAHWNKHTNAAAEVDRVF